MLNRLLPAVVTAVCLLMASGAAAAPGDAFTATSTPSHVKPSISASYTITLTNSASSPSRGQRATIAIPSGFDVSPASIQATTEALGGCDGSTWVPDGAPIADSKIQLKRPMGPETGLCQGAKLTVSFAATSPGAEGSHTWTSQLFVGDEEFLLTGSQPPVVVDGTAPETTIDSGPPAVTNSTSASFSFSSSEAGSAFECNLDGGAFASCTSPTSYTALGDGAHTFEVRANDLAGNIDASSAGDSWTVDLTAPETTIDSGPPAVTNATSASFTFSSDEPAAPSSAASTARPSPPAPAPRATRPRRGRAHVRGPRDRPGRQHRRQPRPAHLDRRLNARRTDDQLRRRPAETNATSASFTFSVQRDRQHLRVQPRRRRLHAPAPAPRATPASARRRAHFEVRATDAAGNTDASPGQPHLDGRH